MPKNMQIQKKKTSIRDPYQSCLYVYVEKNNDYGWCIII